MIESNLTNRNNINIYRRHRMNKYHLISPNPIVTHTGRVRLMLRQYLNRMLIKSTSNKMHIISI